jgi:hypothetical protein
LNEVTINVYVSSNDVYPHLLHALGKEEDGFNPRDPSIQKVMRGLLAELIDLLSKDYELNIIDSANNSVSYVRVLKTSSDRSFQNSKEWLDVAIKVAKTKHGGTYEAAYHTTNHLLPRMCIPFCIPVPAGPHFFGFRRNTRRNKIIPGQDYFGPELRTQEFRPEFRRHSMPRVTNIQLAD